MKRRKPATANSRAKPKAKNHLHNLKALTIRITAMSRSGAGLGRDDNQRVTFVPFTAPGDLVKAKLTKATNKYAECRLVEVIEPSEQRITPKCPVFTLCGGCQWQHLPYELQWQTKLQGVKDSLQLNQIDVPTSVEAFPAEQIWAYRNRIQLKGDSNAIGFYEAKSNKLVNIDQCPIADQKLNDVINETAKEAKEKLTEKDKTFKVELALETDGSVSKTWNAHHGATGFRQVNDEQNKHLQTWIKQNLNEDIAVLDLYGGSGNLSIPLIDQAAEIHCVDLNVPDSTNGLPDYFHFHRSSVLPWLKQHKCDNKLNWVALIDPPRDGLGNEVEEILQCLKKAKVKTIILVGCKTDPSSRDISRLLSDGWKLKKVAVMDFFPQTHHVESIAMLVR